MNTSRNQMFDVIKFLCAILIVLHHFQMEIGGTLKYVNFFGGAFYFGFLVELFFLMSGYFMYPYINKIENGLTFMDFFKRRFFRYTPLVVVSVILFDLITLITNKIIGFPGTISWNLFTSIITGLSIQSGWGFDFNLCGVNNYALWYVSALQLCYILFYFLTYIHKKKKINYNYIYLLAIIVGICFRTYKLNTPFLNYKLCRGYYSFFFGLMFAEFVQKYTFNNKKN